MDIRKLQRAIVDGLEDVKATDIVLFNTEHLSPLFERVVIASGTSNRQTKALASSVRESVKAAGGEILSVEGEDNGEWIIVDCGAAVAHIMQPAIRQYYHLEEIWGGKTVRLKLAEQIHGLPKASEGDDEDEAPAAAKPVRRSSTAKASPGPRRSGSASEAKSSSAPAKKASRPAAKSSARAAGAAPRKTASKAASAGAPKPAAKKAAAKKAAAKKAVARKTTKPAARPAAKRGA